MGEKLYSAKKGKKISKFSGFGSLSSGRFAPNRVLPGYGKEGEGRCAVGPARQPKGRWVPVTSGRKEREGGCARGPRGRGSGPGKGKWGSWPSAGFSGGFPSFFSSFLFWFFSKTFSK